jgi:hypothetical protein
LKAHYADKIAVWDMKLAIEKFQWNSRCGTLDSPITSAALSKIVIYCPMLRVLDFDNSFGDAAIIRVAECCPMLL